MELLQNSGFVAAVIFIINLIFLAGFWFRKLKDAVTVKEMEVIVNQEVEKQLANHCPFHNDIGDLKLKLGEHEIWIKEHEKWAAVANEANHLLLQELVLNTKRICEKIDIKYLRQNGNGA